MPMPMPMLALALALLAWLGPEVCWIGFGAQRS